MDRVSSGDLRVGDVVEFGGSGPGRRWVGIVQEDRTCGRLLITTLLPLHSLRSWTVRECMKDGPLVLIKRGDLGDRLRELNDEIRRLGRERNKLLKDTIREFRQKGADR